MLTEQKQRSIVDIVMATGTIKLGAYKKLSRNPLPSGQLESFFYGGGVLGRLYWLMPDTFGTKERYVSCAVNPARQHLIFYDNPIRKRDARCTNIPHTGAILSDMGVGRLLRKGFQEWWRGSLTMELIKAGSETKVHGISLCQWLIVADQLPKLESLSSAAANKAPSEKYGVMINKTLPCLKS